MTKRLDHAISKIRELSKERQDEAADVLLSMVEQGTESIQPSDEQMAEVQRRLDRPSNRTSHADVRRFFHQRTA